MTKKIISLLVAAMMVLAILPAAAFAKTETAVTAVPEKEPAKAAWVAGQWDFEEDPTANGWQFLDQDGDGNNWTWTTDYYNSETHSIMSGSFVNGEACSPDNWAVLPVIDLPANAEITLFYSLKGQSTAYPETYTIMLGFEEDLSDMSQICGDLSTSTESNAWEQRTISLTEFNGHTVYIAFRNYGTYDQWKMYIDDVMITVETGTPQPIIPIESVDVSGIPTELQEGDYAPDLTAGIHVPDGAPYAITDIMLVTEDDYDAVGNYGYLEAGVEYKWQFVVEANEGYGFTDECVITANGGELTLIPETGVINSGRVWMNCEGITAIPLEEPPAEYAIHEVYVDGYESPVAGEDSQNYLNFTTPADAHYHIYMTDWSPEWWDNDVDDEFFGTFVEGTLYSVGMTIQAEDDYYFADDCVFYVNDDENLVDWTYSGIDTDDNTVCYVWTVPEPATAGEEPPVVNDLDAALNVEGGTLHFDTTETYPWIVVEEGGRVFAQSSNGGNHSTSSDLVLVVDLDEAQTIYFEFKAWGEGSYTFWDHCDFSIDGEVQFTYGAYDNDWELYSCIVPAGVHTLNWTYTKDSSVNPNGDYFAVDNVSLGAAPEYTVTFVDGLDGSTIGEITVEAATVLTDADFPTPPEHEGYEFIGWSYSGQAIMEDTTITARYRDPNAPNAYVILNVPEDVWGDGSGYQMLLDADATAYGTIIPVSGGLTSSGDAPAGVYDEFEYKIPENADGAMTTQNMLVQGQIMIEIPAGIYDWCITNPTPGDRIWIASSNGNIPGRYDDYEFEAGLTYTFTVTLGGQNDRVDLEITEATPPTEPTLITEGYINDFTTPEWGMHPNFYASIPADANYTLTTVTWTSFDAEFNFVDMTSEDVFDNEQLQYYAAFALVPNEGYEFAEDCIVYINGGEDLVDFALTDPDYMEVATINFTVENPDETIPIHEVWVDGWGTPVEGVVGIDHVFLYTPDGVPYYIVYGGWLDETDQQQMWSEDHIFIAGHEYSEGCQIWCEEGYYFADDCVFHTNDGDEILDLAWCYVDEEDNWICYMNILPVVCEGEEPPVPEMHGDVDLNGTVQVADAILALRYQMGLIELTDEQLAQAEVTGDGQVTLADAILILRYAMGLIDHFPIEG